MTLLKRDYLNPNKFDTIKPAAAVKGVVHESAMGYEDTIRILELKVGKLTEIVGALIETLASKELVTPDLTAPHILEDLDIRNILQDPYLTSGVAQSD